MVRAFPAPGISGSLTSGKGMAIEMLSDMYRPTLPDGVTMIQVAQRDVLAGDPQPVVQVLRAVIAAPGAWRRLRGKVLFLIDGWDHDRREICEIPEVRAYWAKLDALFPAWSYFVVPGDWLRVLALCLVPVLRVSSSGKLGDVAWAEYTPADLIPFVTRALQAVTEVEVDEACFEAFRQALLRSLLPGGSAAA